MKCPDCNHEAHLPGACVAFSGMFEKCTCAHSAPPPLDRDRFLERIAVALEKIADAVAPIELGHDSFGPEFSTFHETLAALSLDGIETAFSDHLDHYKHETTEVGDAAAYKAMARASETDECRVCGHVRSAHHGFEGSPRGGCAHHVNEDPCRCTGFQLRLS